MRLTFGVLIAAAVVGCQPVQPPLMDTDKTAMRAATDSFTVYVLRRRDSAAAALYDERGRLMPPNHVIVEGRAAIRAYIAALPPLSRFTATNIEIDGRGDIAYLRGTYQMTFAAAEGRPAADDRGKFLEIRRRREDGRWLIVVDIYNSDLPASGTPSK